MKIKLFGNDEIKDKTLQVLKNNMKVELVDTIENCDLVVLCKGWQELEGSMELFLKVSELQKEYIEFK